MKRNRGLLLLLSLGILVSDAFAQNNRKCPCDIYKEGGTPCVAAHSMVRALYNSYNGYLYQIKRASDNKTLDIGLKSPGGYVNTALVDSFLRGATGTVSIIYDQSERKNHLTVSLYGSAAPNPLKETPITRLKDTISGHIVYPLATEPGEGYRNNKTSGVATGSQAEGMYMVCSGNKIAKAMAAQTDWRSCTQAGAPRNDQVKIIPVASRPFQAVIVPGMAFSTTSASAVSGGVLLSSLRPPHGTVSSTTFTSSCTGTPTTRVVGFLIGCFGI